MRAGRPAWRMVSVARPASTQRACARAWMPMNAPPLVPWSLTASRSALVAQVGAEPNRAPAAIGDAAATATAIAAIVRASRGVLCISTNASERRDGRRGATAVLPRLIRLCREEHVVPVATTPVVRSRPRRPVHMTQRVAQAVVRRRRTGPERHEVLAVPVRRALAVHRRVHAARVDLRRGPREAEDVVVRRKDPPVRLVLLEVPRQARRAHHDVLGVVVQRLELARAEPEPG